MNYMVKIAALLSSALFLRAASALTVEEATDQAMSSTNFWGVSLAEYRLRISQSVPFLATNDAQLARQRLCDWYVSLASLSSPTNSITVYDSWLDEQVMALSAYSRFLVDIQFTNAWSSAASRLGALREEIPSKDELRQRFYNMYFYNGYLADDHAVSEKILVEQDFVFARQRASEILARSVLEVFGRRGIPLLPIEERSSFVSNYIYTAHLSTEEAEGLCQ